MLKKIIASDILVCDFDYTYGLIPADTVIYDASKKLDIQPRDSQKIKLLMELARDPLYINSYNMKLNNSKHEGCLEIWTDEFQYTVLYFDGIPCFESIREFGKLKILIGIDESDNFLPEYYISLNKPYPTHAKASDQFVLRHTVFGDIINDELSKIIVRDSNFYCRLPKLIEYSTKEKREET